MYYLLSFLKALENCFHADDDQTRQIAIEILGHLVEYNASMVRDYALKQSRDIGVSADKSHDPKLNLLNLVIDQIFTGDKLVTKSSKKTEIYCNLTMFR